jgi:hypothetical protein
MDDLIERAEAVIREAKAWMYRQLLVEILTELKKIRAENSFLHGEIDRMRVRGDY